MVRLHLGCGGKRLRGYVNVDSSPTDRVDLVCDITALPHEEGSVDEILAVHAFEHIFPWLAEDALKHWHKILKVGGKLILEMPDLKKVLEFFKAEEISLTLTMNALYGGEKTGRIEDVHKYCWTFASLEPLFVRAGFTNVQERPALYHIRERDFRIEGTK